MTIKSLLTGAVLGLGLSGAASAATLVTNSDGLLVGAEGVDVGGTLYDVTFVDGSCDSLFAGCDENEFTFRTSADAVAASQALLDQVFVDDPQGDPARAFDSNPALTFGCGFADLCLVDTFYDAGDTFFEAGRVRNSAIDDDAAFEGSGINSFPYGDFDIMVYAQWSIAVVPLPAGLPLLLAGLGALALVRRRQG